MTGEEETVETVADGGDGEEERGRRRRTPAAAPVLSTAAEASTGTTVKMTPYVSVKPACWSV